MGVALPVRLFIFEGGGNLTKANKKHLKTDKNNCWIS
jgi:hypothetical protein